MLGLLDLAIKNTRCPVVSGNIWVIFTIKKKKSKPEITPKIVYLKFKFQWASCILPGYANKRALLVSLPSLQKPFCEFGMFLSGVKQVAEKAGG